MASAAINSVQTRSPSQVRWQIERQGFRGCFRLSATGHTKRESVNA